MENYNSDFNNPKILIVEDECLTAMELKNNLKDCNYDILTPLSSGEEAIEVSKTTKPNLILMDIMLAGKINGIEASKEIKKFLDIPIIYLTAYGDYETLQNAKFTEPHAYILKPFNEKEIRYAIEIALHKHKMELKIKEKEKKFRLMYYKSPLAYQLLDEDGYIIDVNQTWVNVLGYSLEEVIGHNFTEFLLSADSLEFKEKWKYYKETGIQRKELILRCKDGSDLPIELEIKRIYDDDADFKHLGIFNIISHHKYEQEKVMESLIQKEILLEEISNQLQNNFNEVHNLIKSESSEILGNIEHKNNKSQNQTYKNKLETLKEEITFVDFAQYVESLVDDLIFSNSLDESLDINLNVDKVMLDLETSLSYGLILIEILKVSINNLFLNKKKCIKIDFQLFNNSFILKINDDLVNYSKIMESNNSSFKLINTLVKQHQGSIGFDKNNFSEIQIIFGIK